MQLTQISFEFVPLNLPRSDTDLREFIKTYPAYDQALLLFIVDFRQMHDFLAENNTANMPPCNYKPHGSTNIFLNHLAREDVQNFMLRHGAKRYDYLSELLDTIWWPTSVRIMRPTTLPLPS